MADGDVSKCRACLVDNVELLSIYENHVINEEIMKIADIFTACAPIQVKIFFICRNVE